MMPVVRARPARLLVALLAALALGVAGCGIPTDDAPRPLADPTTTTEPPPDTGGGASTATIYLSQADRPGQLVRVERSLDGPPTPGRVLDALFNAPLEQDTAAGYSTLIIAGTRAVGTEVEGDLISVEMSEEWGTLGAGATGAYAQVVFTLTDLPGLARVRFLIDGEEISAPTVNEGAQVVVDRSDYASFEPADG